MTQVVWLKPNRRILFLAMAVPLVIAAAGAVLLGLSIGAVHVVGATLLVIGIVLAAALAAQSVRPRLALRNEELLVYLRLTAPLAVPLSIVECVFLGRPETQLALGQHTSRMVSLVIRLAESATQYKERRVKPALGRWADGYITIHGAWCEPLTLELAQRINSQLRKAQQSQRRESQRKIT